MKLRIVLILTLAAALAAPSVASAAKVVRGSGFYRLRAETGEQNRLKVTITKDAVVFADSGADRVVPTKEHAKRLCKQVTTRRLRCPLPPRRDSFSPGVFALLGDGDDRVTFKNTKGGRVGGVGDGEAGTDVLTAAPAGSSLHGGEGADRLTGGEGDDFLDGGDATDQITGGDGRDTAAYIRRSERTAPVTATLDGLANDGTPGENDAIAADVENLDVGGGFFSPTPDDTVIGNSGKNVLSGSGQVRGLDGDDRLSGSGTLHGGDGNDAASVDQSGRVFGGFGNDRLNGYSEGTSEVHGGPGNDTIDVVDEGCDGVECSVVSDPDPLDCGPGTDVAYVDPGDTAPPDCEIVGLVRDDRPVELRGTEARDRISGSARNERIEGLGGDDVLGGRGGRDHLIGGEGEDLLDGDKRSGFDGKGFKDRLSGGDDDDTIRARDDARDSIRCGAGDDTVTADEGDRVADDCETVSRR